MPKAFKRRIDFKGDGKKLNDKTIKKLQVIGGEIISGIVKRTLSGKDIKGKSFKPYNNSYKTQRAKKGRSSKPNLSFTGNMLGALNTKRINNGVRLYFIGAEENRKARENQKTRKFFGIDAMQKAHIKKRIKNGR